MAQTDDLLPSHDSDSKPIWRCQHCQELMYLRDADGYPAPGAPLSYHIDTQYTQVCFLCFCLYHNARFSHSYWQNLHEEWKKKKSNVDRLTGRTDYFTGA